MIQVNLNWLIELAACDLAEGVPSGGARVLRCRLQLRFVPHLACDGASWGYGMILPVLSRHKPDKSPRKLLYFMILKKKDQNISCKCDIVGKNQPENSFILIT